jgi:MFS family permease
MSELRPAAPPKSIVPVAMPAGVWVLGCVSMLMDISSEMIHSLLPLFLVGTLGVSVLAVGIIEGLAESTALISKVFSGALSDYLGKRKGLALLGYAMGALTKPVFALATGVGTVVAARFIDRVGKGIRGAPRDALLADITPPSIRGAAFGLRQSLDTVGAFAGPLLATGLMLAWANDFRAVFWVAVIPGVLAVLLLVVGIREPEHDRPRGAVNPIRREALARLDRRYWWVVGVGAVFMLARFSEAFLVLRASQLDVPVAWVPLVMVAMNLVYAACAYPFGKLSDTVSHGKLLAAGLVVLIASDLVLAAAIRGLATVSRGWARGRDDLAGRAQVETLMDGFPRDRPDAEPDTGTRQEKSTEAFTWVLDSSTCIWLPDLGSNQGPTD